MDGKHTKNLSAEKKKEVVMEGAGRTAAILLSRC